MAKKGLAKIAKRRRQRAAAPTKNPPLGSDLLSSVLPGFAAYAASRLLSRLAYAIIQRKWPRLGKYAGAAAATGTFGAAWIGAHRIKQLQPYHDVIVIGSGIAALQSIAQLIPKYGWIVSDPLPGDVAPAQLPASTATPDEVAAAAAEMNGDEYSYLERELERAARGANRRRMTPGTTPVPPPEPEVSDEDLAGILDDDEDMADLYTGSFAN